MRKPADKAQVDAEVQRVVELRHPEPHSVLGIHPDGDGVVIRAFRPDAVALHVLPESGGRVAMTHRQGGVFEARINGKDQTFNYLLEVEYPGKRVFTLRDPYSFLPTLGEMDLYYAGEGRHERLWERMGAHLLHHNGVRGTSFAVWAPTAAGVSVVGDFNGWDGRLHSMRRMGSSGIWELFVPEVGEGTRYKFEIRPGQGGANVLKADPFAFRTEVPPATASVVHDLARYQWNDAAWLDQRAQRHDVHHQPWSVYEIHLGSWRRVVEDGDRPMTYRELAPALAEYIKFTGFTHVELLPVAEHPYGGSWGYQVGGYYAPTARFGHPDDLRFFIDHMHQEGIGVLVDWVPGHFPRDLHALGQFDGTSLYEHADPRKGAQPDWGTLVFNFGRNEVRNFLIANALFWIEEYHIDGLRVDAVASMLYLDYSRKQGEWIPNRWGGRENEEAIHFMRELNETVRRKHPGVVVIAEESTAWPKVSSPVEEGGLGFHFKWNMGWMHDTLSYFSKDPIYRQYHHNQLTFGLLYAFSEHFMLPLSHDEVVHGKGSLYGRMPGDPWQKRANLRALFAWMWAHPGKKLVFMGGEFGQPAEWNHDKSLDWHLTHEPGHRGILLLMADLNRIYRDMPALYDADSEPMGFQWLQPDAAADNVFAFVRRSRQPGRHVVCIANLSPAVRENYRVGFPLQGRYVELLNTDAEQYGGSNRGNMGQLQTEPTGWDGQPASATITLPPLSVLWFTPG
ncbi:1,4-alpha-glucan (glycogen) branching enzyme, GH-13-type [Myxococcus hansupus]|uniref:1,4-alpha-glucan branching enzyme GlgB n=1 Tax=Pseudomyxococcus hansupus TaxID=1297742 RepID=A0A0H4WYB0_9BACT|nr:1,4-alpha-glucan branching protein GlgB [Myxococcus hansupus]AKQ66345.1 1,4-alpha-glucan (glycogen) branching enzyme, GH-13-type [Myxococcus hansupus]